jgi:phosphoglycerol transferase
MAVQLDQHRTYVPIRRKGRFQRAGSLAPGTVAALASLAIAYVVLQLWDASLKSPWTLGGTDIWVMLSYMKMTLQQAWPFHTPLLGAPYGGLDMHDFPQIDPLQVVLTKLIGLFSNDVAVVTNVFFLVGFPLTAIAAVWSLRRLDVPTWIAVACAVVFAVAPYHFFRGEDHLLIAAYYTVPLAAYLILRQLAGSPPSARTTIVLAALVGLGSFYYVVFTLFLLGFAVVLSLVGGRRAVAWSGALALAVLLATTGLVHAPTFVYQLRHGSNQAVAVLRGPEQSERFALKIPRLVFPVDQHEIKPLANLTQHFNERSPTQIQEGPPQALGLLTAIGFVALLWIAISGPFRRPGAPERDPYVQASATATLAALILGVAGGAALVVAYAVTPLVRSWSRLSIFIAFFALVAVAKGLERVHRDLRARGVRPVFMAVGLCALVAAAAGEQTSVAMVPDYRATNVVWRSDAAFTSRATQLLPRNSIVFELPYVPYPEASYSQARPYLHTTRLRWTFGAMQGRPADWTASLMGLPTRPVVASAAAAGASAILVASRASPATSQAISALLGRPLVASDIGDLALYDLRPYAARLGSRLGQPALARLRYLTLHPMRVLPGPQLSAPQNQGGIWTRLSYSRKAELDLVNPLSQPRAVTFSLRISSRGSARSFTVELPNGARIPFDTRKPSAVVKMTLLPGRNRVFVVDNTKPHPFESRYFSIDRATVQDQQAAAILSRAG